jgi:hypothetical protein
MRSPQAHEVKAQITEFLAKVKTDNENDGHQA